MSYSNTLNIFGSTKRKEKKQARRNARTTRGGQDVKHALADLKHDVIMGDEKAIARAVRLFEMEEAQAKAPKAKAKAPVCKAPKAKKAPAKKANDVMSPCDFIKKASKAGMLSPDEAVLAATFFQAMMQECSTNVIPDSMKGSKVWIPCANGGITISFGE